jgi:nucleoside-diphosphate-sugar epimerase
MVGKRLVEMLLEINCNKIISIDLSHNNNVLDDRVVYEKVNICDYESICNVLKKVDVIFHVAALVGP